MSYAPGDTLRIPVTGDTLTALDGTTSPYGLYRNGTRDAAVTVTVTGTGNDWLATLTIPSGYSLGDTVWLKLLATTADGTYVVTSEPIVLADLQAAVAAAIETSGLNHFVGMLAPTVPDRYKITSGDLPAACEIDDTGTPSGVYESKYYWTWVNEFGNWALWFSSNNSQWVITDYDSLRGEPPDGGGALIYWLGGADIEGVYTNDLGDTATVTGLKRFANFAVQPAAEEAIVARSQTIRDAMKLTPSVGIVATGSIDSLVSAEAQQAAAAAAIAAAEPIRANAVEIGGVSVEPADISQDVRDAMELESSTGEDSIDDQLDAILVQATAAGAAVGLAEANLDAKLAALATAEQVAALPTPLDVNETQAAAADAITAAALATAEQVATTLEIINTSNIGINEIKIIISSMNTVNINEVVSAIETYLRSVQIRPSVNVLGPCARNVVAMPQIHSR